MALFKSNKSLGELRSMDIRAKKQAKVDLFFNRASAKREKLQRQYDPTVAQRVKSGFSSAYNSISEPTQKATGYVSQRAEKLASGLSNASNIITRGLPKKGPFFSRTPGEPMSASVVKDASNLTVEYQ